MVRNFTSGFENLFLHFFDSITASIKNFLELNTNFHSLNQIFRHYFSKLHTKDFLCFVAKEILNMPKKILYRLYFEIILLYLIFNVVSQILYSKYF